jgi:hypothetical protein
MIPARTSRGSSTRPSPLAEGLTSIPPTPAVFVIRRGARRGAGRANRRFELLGHGRLVK